VALRTKTYFWGDVIILRCVGRLVAGQQFIAFRQGVEKLLSEGRRIVINLTEVDHVDSTGLAALVRFLTQRRDPESGARTRRVRVSENAEKLSAQVEIKIWPARLRGCLDRF
jgi:anti-anti-sigma regulatory factor